MQSDHDLLAEDLFRVLADGDAGEVFGIVGAMLDRGELDRLRSVSAHVEAAMAPGAVDLLAQAVEDESQRFEMDGMHAELFCIPCLIDPQCLQPLDAAAVCAALRAQAGHGATVVVADGWVHLHDLLALDPVGYRALSRAMAAAAFGGAVAMPLNAGSFPRFPAGSGDRAGAAEVIDCASGGSHRQIAARFVLGALARPARARRNRSLVGDICGGEADRGTADTLAGILSGLIPDTGALLVPAQPYLAAVWAAGAIECIMVEARMKAAAIEIGRKPIAHFCADDDWFHIVLTRDGKTVIDTMRILGCGIDSEHLAEAVDGLSAAMVHHHDVSDLPKAATAGRALH